MLDLTPSILYEDKDIVVINKPAGLVVHSDGRTKEPTVADWVKDKYPETAQVGEPIELKNGASIERPGIVHRIDRETSGILVIAKTAEGFECLKAQFQNREVEKFYHLFVHGLVKEDRGSITRPIGKSSSDFRKWSAQRGAKGEMRDALTYFEVLKRSAELGVSFVEAKPKTGRTHQIRVHFQALQHPVIGDNLYASGKEKLLGFERTALHARKITFMNVEGKKITVEAPYPLDFEKALKEMS